MMDEDLTRSEINDLSLPFTNKISDIAIIIINLTEPESGSWNYSGWANHSFYEDISMFRWAELIFKGTVLTLIIFLTIFGNLLVLMAVTFTSTLRSTTNCFIVNLALADLLLGISVLPFSATLELNEKQWLFGQIFCNIWAATDVLCCTASILSLCVISVDRYIGVTRPLNYSNIVTNSRATLACFCVWVLSIAISVGPLLGWKDPPPENPFVCEVTKQLGYVLFSVLFSFYLPCLIIFIVYFRIYKAAVRQTKFLQTGVKVIKPSGKQTTKELTLRVHAGAHNVLSAVAAGSACGEKSSVKLTFAALQGRLAKFKRQKKAAKTLGIVVGVFILCWFPFFFLLPLGTLCTQCYIPDLLFDIFFWTGYFNSCLNPIIYACSSREFKRAFRQVLHCAGLSSGRDLQSFRARTINFTLRSTRRSSGTDDKKISSPPPPPPVQPKAICEAPAKPAPEGIRPKPLDRDPSRGSIADAARTTTTTTTTSNTTTSTIATTTATEAPPPYYPPISNAIIRSPVVEIMNGVNSSMPAGPGTDIGCVSIGISE